MISLDTICPSLNANASYSSMKGWSNVGLIRWPLCLLPPLPTISSPFSPSLFSFQHPSCPFPFISLTLCFNLLLFHSSILSCYRGLFILHFVDYASQLDQCHFLITFLSVILTLFGYLQAASALINQCFTDLYSARIQRPGCYRVLKYSFILPIDIVLIAHCELFKYTVCTTFILLSLYFDIFQYKSSEVKLKRT